MWVTVFLLYFFYICDIPLNDAHCVDIHSHIVSQGLHYVPGPNPCTLCICDKGNPKWCKQVLCSPPENCKSFQVGNSCCEFKCLDDILSKSDNITETYDLALRLIASAVTAVLSLSLLFFLIHRLRQRKIRLRQNRQLSEDQRSLNSIGYITGSLGYLPGSIGYLGSGNNELEFHYDESNVHYPLWKPPGNYFPRGEAPPPYEEAVRAARAEAELINNHNQVTSTSTPYTFPSSRNENVSLTLVHNTHVSITPSVQQPGVASSQCNVLLHQSNNVQSLQQEARTDSVDNHNQSNSSASVSLACDSASSFIQNATLESQVDVHYENYNHNVSNAAPVLTVSVKNEESFPKQSLNVDFIRPEKGQTSAASASIENTHNQSISKTESSNPACSNSWRRESGQSTSKSNLPPDVKQKILEKNKNYKHIEAVSAPSSSKNYRCDGQFVDSKYKKCNGTLKDSARKSSASKTFDKHRPQLKTHAENHKEVSLPETTKHRTIPQKFSKTLDTDMCYVNTAEITKRKFDEEFTEHCDGLLKQHNVDKIRTNEKLDRKTLEKVVNSGSVKSSLCKSDTRSTQKTIGMLKGDISAHRTLPKNLKELSEAFYFNFDNSVAEELNLDCLVKKTLPRSTVSQSETPLCIEKQIKSENSVPYSTNTLGRKYAQDKKSSNLSSLTCSVTPSYYRNQIETVKTVSEKIDTSNDIVVHNEPEPETNKNSVYQCLSPAQDDVDDYRSECENCKSLSFEDCNDEEGDLLNETMTLQRRPMEQGEEHSFYRTSLTLPSHNKKTRSVTLNTPRESWFMAMQEMTSSSESD